MEVFIEKEGETRTVSFDGTVKALLDMLGVPTETVLIVKDGQLITEDDSVEDKDKVDLLSVISGG